MSAMGGMAFRGLCLGTLLLASVSCVSRQQYDRLVTEYYSEKEARQSAEEDLVALEGEIDDYRLRAEDAEARASRAGEESSARVGQLQSALAAARNQLEGYRKEGGITVLPTEDGFRILVDDKLLFDAGSTALKSDGKVALNKIASEILSKGYSEVRIDGHTDSDPVQKTRDVHPLGNHELAAKRALSVFGYLTNIAKVPESKLSLAAFGPNRPLVQGSTPAAKQRNRRVEIQVRVDPAN